MIKKGVKGFTLIEVMIVVAILGVIAAIATPSYVENVRKSKRSDAKVELLRIAQLQESYFVQNLSYAKDLTSSQASGGLGLSSPVESEQGIYTISLSSKDNGGGACTGVSADPCTSFTITATPGTKQKDPACKNFKLLNTGKKEVTGTYSSDPKKCW